MSKSIRTYGLLFLLFLAAFGLLSVFYYSQTREYAILEAEKKIQNYLLVHKAIHGFVEEIQKPVIYKLKEEDKLYDDFFAPELLSFTFIARNIKDYYNKEREKAGFVPYYFKLASANPRNEINRADSFEIELLDKMNSEGLKEVKKIIQENGSKFLYYAIAINPNVKSCMRCHSDPVLAPSEMTERYGDKAGFYEKIGTIRAMISIKAPLEGELKDADSVFYVLCAVTFFIFMLIYSILVFFIKRLNKKDEMIKERNSELELFNQHLEQLVAAEIEKRNSQQNILIQQSKMAAMGEMTAAIAHQWKQPLNSLNLIIEYLSEEFNDKYPGNEDFKKMISNAESQICFMSQTVNDFRNFYKPDKTEEKFDIVDTIKDVEKLVAPQLKHYSIEMAYDMEMGRDFNIYGNKSELMQVLLNLVNNSRDAVLSNREKIGQGKYKGVITCAVVNEKDNIIINISDNGGGIPQDSLEKMFVAYYTTKQKEEGTGLGLYMSKMIIEDSFKGSMQAFNIDGGACFKIILPKNKD